MLRTGGSPAKPDIQRAIDAILKEDSNFDRTENRSAHRESLVRPVEIELRESNTCLQAFSRNISGLGIGLITSELILEKSMAVLTIEKLSGQQLTILAECRWCKAFGENWHFSGWQFINLKR